MSDEAETPILDLIATMTEASVEASSLDPQSLMLVRIAALMRDAPAFLHVEPGGRQRTRRETVEVFAAVAPIVGTARVASAAASAALDLQDCGRLQI
jgi:hypothetical protein